LNRKFKARALLYALSGWKTALLRKRDLYALSYRIYTRRLCMRAFKGTNGWLARMGVWRSALRKADKADVCWARRTALRVVRAWLHRAVDRPTRKGDAVRRALNWRIKGRQWRLWRWALALRRRVAGRLQVRFFSYHLISL
jgi:hypothetical protein